MRFHRLKTGITDPKIVETYIVADEATVDIGNGVMANAMAFKSCSDAGLTNCTTPEYPVRSFGSRWETGSSCIL